MNYTEQRQLASGHRPEEQSAGEDSSFVCPPTTESSCMAGEWIQTLSSTEATSMGPWQGSVGAEAWESLAYLANSEGRTDKHRRCKRHAAKERRRLAYSYIWHSNSSGVPQIRQLLNHIQQSPYLRRGMGVVAICERQQ